MDIPDDALEEFKCSGCEGFLFQGPVFQQHDGAAVCGRCHATERPATSNKQYEAAARYLRFPCKNRNGGCRRTMLYGAEQDRDMHEEECNYREFVCPVLGCDWLGFRSDILKHCQTQHPDRVLDSPCVLTHDISKSNENTFLLCALQVLFLLHTEVCVATGKMYHAVRYLGASNVATNFCYILDIKCGDELISKKGQVTGQGCRANQEPTPPALDPNSLLSVLGGFDGATTFTVTMREVCNRCKDELKALLYCNDKGWCKTCTSDTRLCKNHESGCQYRDIHSKCYKHERYFCEQDLGCFLGCYTIVESHGLLAHYALHKKIMCGADAIWHASPTSFLGKYVFVPGAAGTAVCHYKLSSTHFDLDVYTPVSSAQLSEFRCVVQLTDKVTRKMHTFMPEAEYQRFCDWYINVTKADMPSWSGHCVVRVAIRKTEDFYFL